MAGEFDVAMRDRLVIELSKVSPEARKVIAGLLERVTAHDWPIMYQAACGALHWGFDPLTDPLVGLAHAIPALSFRVHELEGERADYLDRLRTQAAAAKVRIDKLEAENEKLRRPMPIVPLTVDASVPRSSAKIAAHVCDQPSADCWCKRFPGSGAG